MEESWTVGDEGVEKRREKAVEGDASEVSEVESTFDEVLATDCVDNDREMFAEEDGSKIAVGEGKGIMFFV